MTSRHDGDADFVEGVGGLPPIHFLNLRILRDGFAGEARADAERDGKSGTPSGGNAAQSGDVEMIVVVVALQDQVDSGKLIEMDSGGAVARRTDPRERAGAMRPDGIAEDVEAFELDQERGMSDEGGGAGFRICCRRCWRACDASGRPNSDRRASGDHVLNATAKENVGMYGFER